MNIEQQRHYGPDAKGTTKEIDEGWFRDVAFGPCRHHRKERRSPLGGEPRCELACQRAAGTGPEYGDLSGLAQRCPFRNRS
jgi:hypothetical protein